MKLTFLAVAPIALSCACTLHLHVHEAPAQISLPGNSNGVGSHMIAGVVVGDRGHPIQAQVAVVGAQGGSRSMRTCESGAFRFGDLGAQEYAVTATLTDGQISVLRGVRPGAEVRLPPMRDGATAMVEIRGRPTARLAVIHDGARVHDITVLDGKPSAVVIPTGSVRLLIYWGASREERHLTILPGDSISLRFDLES